jgi:hypothetical protein
MAESEHKQPDQLRTGNWFRFRLGSLFGLVSAICLLLWVDVARENRRRGVLEELQRVGGAVEFRAEAGDRARRLANVIARALGKAERREVAMVYLDNCSGVNAQLLGKLSAFPELDKLSLNMLPVGDDVFKGLPQLANLKELSLRDTPISDDAIREIVHMRGLEHLDLGWTNVTDLGAAHLSALPELRSVVLSRSKVTERGANTLRQALPKCQVIYSDIGF